MKIELELPDWVDGTHIRVFAGIEQVAYKYVDEPWMIKTSRCNMCGECCKIFKEDSENVTDGICNYLIPDGDNKMVCALGINRPFRCSAVVMTDSVEGCTEKYEEYDKVL